MSEDAWLSIVENSMRKFSEKYKFKYALRKNVSYALFEIGCYLLIVGYYSKNCANLYPVGLVDGVFRYKTSPQGNPANFSFYQGVIDGKSFDIRQQVRVESKISEGVYFTPDIAIILSGDVIGSKRDPLYSKGKKEYFFIKSENVISIHECKSMNPFPELIASFYGFLDLAHEWFTCSGYHECVSKNGIHIAPTLFIGGDAGGLHHKMIKEMRKVVPMNVVIGLHHSEFGMFDGDSLWRLGLA